MLKTCIKYLFVVALIFGCSSNSENEDIDNTVDPIATPKAVDFGALVVETSWISKNTSDRDTFLASAIDNRDWMDIYDNGNVMMTCLAGDSHRTELKENSGAEKSLSIYKKMEYTATLTNIPENGVTIAQIHNRGGVNRPWVRVYVDDDKYIKIKATETTPDESKSTYSTYTGPLYSSGNEFSITITTKNRSASFEINTGNISYSKTLSPSSDWNNYQNSYYLKAGVYTEGDNVEPLLELSKFSIEY